MLRATLSFSVDGEHFKKNLVHLSDKLGRFSMQDGNGFTDFQQKNSGRIALAGVGCINEVISADGNSIREFEKFSAQKNDWLFGFFSYDLKNEIEKLSSANPDLIGMPQLHFFQPEFVCEIFREKVRIHFRNDKEGKEKAGDFFETVNGFVSGVKSEFVEPRQIQCGCRFGKQEYVDSVNEIRKHIKRGDIYELNFCTEFYAENFAFSPGEKYEGLSEQSGMPFSCLYRFGDKSLLCFSPERFICKRGRNLFSQPMKGTIRRGITEREDNELKQKLQNDKKERAENVMIVDLVRNDLSKVAKPGTVQVDELCGVYSFPRVNQMISTVSAEVMENRSVADILRATFPMGSMTGAPKIRAMELIEQFERTKRGLFSGSTGYITPEGDFDFNVVIRSILYNESAKYLSFQAGSAITFHSDPEKEYREIRLKAQLFFEMFGEKLVEEQ